jgi:hypothetical protein
MDFRAASRTRWRQELDDLGRMLQALIAREFANEKVAGQHLKRNSPSYDAWKRRKGFDPRKGHKSNALQRALAGRRLYNINFVAGGRAFITFVESRLQSTVGYAEFYAAAKVQGGKILAVSKRQVDRAAMSIEAFAVRVSQRGNTATAAVVSGASDVAREAARRGITTSTARRLRQQADELAERMDFARRAPLNPQNTGPARIRAGGVTAREMNRLRRQMLNELSGGNRQRRLRIEQALDTGARTANRDATLLRRNLQRILRRVR